MNTNQRAEQHAQIPTFKELGYPISPSGGYSFYIQKDAPKAVFEKLSDAQKEAFERYPGEIKVNLLKFELIPEIPPCSSQEAFRRLIQARDEIIKTARERGLFEK